MNTPSTRLPALDVLRGVAIVWMIGFHLAFDLNHFGWIEPRQQFLADPFWTWQRVCIVSLFMFCAGASQALARGHAVTWPRFWRRWSQVVACAALVSLATWWVFPQSWVSFGVLHGLALMVLVARLTSGWSPIVLVGAAALALVLPQLVSHPVFDNRWLNGIGLVTQKPFTEDYAPLLPWMGMVWLGMVCGPRGVTLLQSWIESPHADATAALAAIPTAGPTGDDRAWAAPLPRGLALIGRWPLTLYMVHQPLFWGTLMLVDSLRP